MDKKQIQKVAGRAGVIFCIVGFFALLYCFIFTDRCHVFTPDQQGDRWMRRGEYAQAAELYQNPMRAGAAYYRAGDFKAAARAFRRISSAEAQFNSGNALVMQGAYSDAVDAYDAALAERPGWKAAETNCEIARLRAEHLKKEGGDMTGGMLGADEIVFTSGKKEGGESETVEGGEPLPDQALQSLWLRRIQTRPAEFLKAKFAYQAQQGDVK